MPNPRFTNKVGDNYQSDGIDTPLSNRDLFALLKSGKPMPNRYIPYGGGISEAAPPQTSQSSGADVSQPRTFTGESQLYVYRTGILESFKRWTPEQLQLPDEQSKADFLRCWEGFIERPLLESGAWRIKNDSEQGQFNRVVELLMSLPSWSEDFRQWYRLEEEVAGNSHPRLKLRD